MKGLGVVRAHAKIVLASVSVLLVAVSLQITSARILAAPVTSRPSTSVGATAASVPARATSTTQHRSESTAPAVKAPIAEAATVPIAGKGMWIWLYGQVEGGNARRIIAKAKRLGLTHIFVRSSSTTDGLKYLKDIDHIVPLAHAAGIKVIAWDFVTLRDPPADVRRLVAVLDHRTRDGQQVDGLAVDLETPSEGVHLTAKAARYLAGRLHQLRPNRFRVLVPPRPSQWTTKFYPYDIIRNFDAVAPMDYWIDVDPVGLARYSVSYLKRFGKPVAPIGQAYDAAVDGGPKGAPSGNTLIAFAAAARAAGAVGVSFWSWQHASPDEFHGIWKIDFPILSR